MAAFNPWLVFRELDSVKTLLYKLCHGVFLDINVEQKPRRVRVCGDTDWSLNQLGLSYNDNVSIIQIGGILGKLFEFTSLEFCLQKIHWEQWQGNATGSTPSREWSASAGDNLFCGEISPLLIIKCVRIFGHFFTPGIDRKLPGLEIIVLIKRNSWQFLLNGILIQTVGRGILKHVLAVFKLFWHHLDVA